MASGTVFPEGITVGPDLLPGNPGTPALEVPAVPGAFCPLGWPCVVTPCPQAGTASATMAATARPLTSFLMIRSLRLDVHSEERLTAAPGSAAMLGRSTRRGDPAIFLGLMMRKALLVVFLLSSCGGVAPNAPSQSEIDNAYCQDMMRQAEHATSMNAAVMQNLAQTQPGPVTRAAADAANNSARYPPANISQLHGQSGVQRR